jgi:hypothetical protein
LIFWDSQATIINSTEEISFASFHSCSKSFFQRSNILRELAKLLNRVQRHTKCSTTYCLRKFKNSKEVVCRFHFSFSIREIFTIFNIVNLKWKSFDFVRNDSLLNTYNLIVSMNWLTNIDFTSCTNQHAILRYIVKYCFKAKIKSFKLIDVFRDVLSHVHVNSKSTMLSLIIKMMNKLIIERDWIAQKICHHLFKRDLKQFSRMTQMINIHSLENQKKQFSLMKNDHIRTENLYIEKYCAREAQLFDVNLYQINKQYDWKKYLFHRRVRSVDKIVVIASSYSSDFQNKNYEKYCWAKVMLHHFFRNLKDLLRDENETIFFSWQNAYQFCRLHHQHVNDALKTVLNDSLEDTKTESVNDKEKLEEIQEEELLNKRNSQKDEKSCSLENKLSNRAQDLNHHWLENQKDFNVNEIKCRVDESKNSIKIEQAFKSLKDVDDKFILNSKQLRLFDRVLNHYLSSSEKQFLIHVNDEVETNKFLCIDMISKHLHYHARQKLESCSIIRATLIDVATHNIQSITLH